MSVSIDSSAGGGLAIQTVSLSLFRYGTLADRLWAFAQMGLARSALDRAQGIGFWKLCGTGTGEGFTPVPNWQVYAVLATWTDPRAARLGLAGAPFASFRHRAAETWTLYLAPVSSRGMWSGVAPFAASDPAPSAPAGPVPGPVAALTRATLKPRIAARFWRRVPAISRRIAADPNVLFKIGIGEVPLLHQVTFSIWPDAASMDAFARADGAHAEAIRAVREGRWFAEELYARFRIEGSEGSWGGRDPLAPQEIAA